MFKINKKKLFKKIRKKVTLDNFLKVLLIFLFSLSTFLLGILYEKIVSRSYSQETEVSQSLDSEKLASIQEKVIKDNYVFKIRWGDLGRRMVEGGVIDKTKLAQAVTGTDKLPEELDKYFNSDQSEIEVNSQNAQFWVDVLWGLGLANKNRILEEGEMMRDGDASIFASTGGWTLGASENAMNYYSKYSYIPLSEKQQQIVEKIANGIYRPCCGNPTSFPDCNHGMAMLGLIELMVSQGKSEEEIYKTALAFNTFWFPQTYLEAALYLDKNGRDFNKVSAKELLSSKFSSAMRDEAISAETQGASWPILENGGSCGA